MADDLHDPDLFRRLGHAIVDRLADHLQQLAADPDAIPVLPAQTPPGQMAAWSASFGGGADPLALLDATLAQAHHLHHPRSVGHQVSPPNVVAVLTDFVANFLNNSAAIFEMGPVATAVEHRIVRWMCDRLGYGAAGGGLLTSGGSLGNLTALLAMRQVEAGHDLWRDGHRAADRFAILVGAQTHYCVERAARVMGLGEDGVVQVPTDRAFRMDIEALPAALAEAARRDRRVIGVVASACSTSTGAIDPLAAIAAFCRERDLWLHVDGAHGASLCISERERHKLAGIEQADSVVWDAHKTLLCPSLVTGVLFRDRRHADASFAPKAEYLFHAEDDDAVALELGRRTLECTKPGFGQKLYVTLAVHGESRLATYLEELIDVVADFADEIERTPDFELAHRPDADIVCFRFTPPGCDDLDELQERVRANLVRSGGYFITRTRLGGRTWLRCTVLHPRTTRADLSELLHAVRQADRVPGG